MYITRLIYLFHFRFKEIIIILNITVFAYPDQRAVVAPLFEAQLDLRVPDMVFTPSLEFGAGDSFFELVECLINDVFRISSLVPRVAQHSPCPHYQVLLV